MNKRIVIADTGVIISLSIIDSLELITQIFGEYYIANSVWIELIKYKSILSKKVLDLLQAKVKEIKGINYLSVIMDFGESESVILYKELNADFLLVDDKKARIIAESYGVNCIGTLGLIALAKERAIISNIRPVFEKLLENKRFYSIDLLNKILQKYEEKQITNDDTNA